MERLNWKWSLLVASCRIAESLLESHQQRHRNQITISKLSLRDRAESARVLWCRDRLIPTRALAILLFSGVDLNACRNLNVRALKATFRTKSVKTTRPKIAANAFARLVVSPTVDPKCVHLAEVDCATRTRRAAHARASSARQIRFSAQQAVSAFLKKTGAMEFKIVLMTRRAVW